MRKSYIGWWIAAGFCLLCGVNAVNSFSDSFTVGLFGLLAIVFFFAGYSRYKAYKEYQHDRAVRNEFYQNQAMKQQEPPEQYLKVTHYIMEDQDDPDEEPAEPAVPKPEAVPNKREGTVMREFSVAGVSRHQDVIRNVGYLNDEYSLSVKRLREEGLLDQDIPKYLFDGVLLNISLELDSENEVDPNAVKVLLNGEHVGFIPADDAEYVHDMIEADRIVDADARIVGGPFKRYDEDEGEMEKVDLFFGIRLDLYIRKGR